MPTPGNKKRSHSNAKLTASISCGMDSLGDHDRTDAGSIRAICVATNLASSIGDDNMKLHLTEPA